MIHLLVIGRVAVERAEHLSAWEGDALTLKTAQRPARALRAFDEWSPDAVVVAEPADSERIGPLLEAIRERPLGQLVPIVLLEAPAEWAEATADHVSVASGREALRERLETEFDLQLDADRDETTPRDAEEDVPTVELDEVRVDDSEDAPGSERIERDGYVVEPLDGEEPSEGPADPARGDRAGGEAAPAPRSAERDDASARVDAEAIERMLRAVRHDDYFAILDVERSADAGDVFEAYRRLEARFEPSALPAALAREYDRELEEIADALEDAKAVLGDETLHTQYLDETTRK